MKSLKTAVIQIAAGPDKAKNLSKTLRLTQQAIRRGTRFIALPETFNFRGHDHSLQKNAEPIPGPSTRAFMELAGKKKVWILIGSLAEKVKGKKKVYNTSVLINDRGRIQAKYRKIHLFDVDIESKKILESKNSLRGEKPVLSSIAGIKAGLSVCYDLRFPYLYHNYAKRGAQILTVPSNFTYATGKVHWEVLLRARAIENQCYVIAPNQFGMGSKKVRAYGNSMIIDPWGKILARASSSAEKILYATLDFRYLDKVRKSLPSLRHSKP